MIPAFPQSKKLELTDKKSLQQIIHKFAPHSDFNFAGLWTYDTQNLVAISSLKGNLVLRTRDYLTNEPFYSFLGNTDIIATVSRLLTHAKKEGIAKCLKLIPESIVVANNLSKYFEVKEDKDNFDYILSIPEVVHLLGEKYKKHRKLIHKFNTLYPSIHPDLLDLTDRHVQRDMFKLFDNWERAKGKEKRETEDERNVLRRALVDPTFLHLFATGFYDGDNLISFFVFDMDHKTYSYSHFFKTLPNYTGAAQALRQFSAGLLEKKGYKYLNIEQDLGIPGLRIAKEQWNPVAYTKKYSIYPKT